MCFRLRTIQGLRRAVDELEGKARLSSSTLIDLIKACGELRAIVEARKVHAHLDRSGFSRDVVLGNHIVNMYVKCGSLEEARSVFGRIQIKDAVLWTAIIAAYAQQHRKEDAFLLFRQMQLEGIAPDAFTLSSMINVCGGYAAEGEALHARVASLGLERERFVGTALVNMHGRCGNVGAAWMVFQEMKPRAAVPWNAMISAFAQNGHYQESFVLFRRMHLEAVVPTRSTYVTVLNACSSFAEGKLVHSLIAESGLEGDVVAGTAVMNMYGKCGRPKEAYAMFLRMRERNAVTWNAIMAAFSQLDRALQLFRQMLMEGFQPSEPTFLAVLSSCKSKETASVLHGVAEEAGCISSVVVATEMIAAYGNLGCLDEALQVFNSVRKYERDEVLWNSMIAARVQAGQEAKAIESFYQMQEIDGIIPDSVSFVTVLAAFSTPDCLAEARAVHASVSKAGLEADVFVGTALVTMYGRCGSPEDAEAVFSRLTERSLVTWNAMIAVQSQRDDAEGYRAALLLFRRMQQQGGIMPDEFTMVSVLTAAANLTDLLLGRRIHGYILDRGMKLEGMVEMGLLNMYSKCGGLEEAGRIFSDMKSGQDSSAWNTIITAYAHHGDSWQALKLFYQMQQAGMRPGSVTFVSVLAACNHGGRAREGIECFVTMVHDHGLRPTVEHCGCVVDLLARAGQLTRAQHLIQGMQEQELSSVTWTSLLAACKLHGDVDGARRAAARVVQLEHRFPSAAAYVALSNACTC